MLNGSVNGSILSREFPVPCSMFYGCKIAFDWDFNRACNKTSGKGPSFTLCRSVNVATEISALDKRKTLSDIVCVHADQCFDKLLPDLS